eukprot:2895725-Rhodomonas_salina.2
MGRGQVGYGKEGELGRVFEELEGDAMRHMISAVQLSMSPPPPPPHPFAIPTKPAPALPLGASLLFVGPCSRGSVCHACE